MKDQNQSREQTGHHEITGKSREVVQSYITTTAMYDFNVYEKRVLYNLVKLAQVELNGIRLSENLYRIDHGLKDTVRIELPLSDFLIDNDDKNYPRVKAALRSLHRKTFTYHDEDTWSCLSIIANPTIRMRSTKVSFLVDTRVWDVILDFSKGFSRYDIEVAFTLESRYSMRFYEFFASQKEPITISIQSLRREFMLENKYKLNKDFIRRVIASAKAELDKRSPVSFEYKAKKTGCAFTHILFIPKANDRFVHPNAFLRQVVHDYGTGSAINSDRLRILHEIGFTEQGIRNNIGLISKAIDHLDFDEELAQIKGKSREKNNPCGWCIKRLKCRLKEVAGIDY